MKHTDGKKWLIIRRSLALTLIFIILISSLSIAMPLAATDNEYDERLIITREMLFPLPPYKSSYEPGIIMVGFYEPYYGTFSNEEFPGLDVIEMKDVKLAQYELYLPYTLREDLNQETVQNTLDYLKNKIGMEYKITISKVTEKSMGEAIQILEQNPDVYWATPNFIIGHAGKPDDEEVIPPTITREMLFPLPPYSSKYEPGILYVGFYEPYFGSFSNEEFPGLDVIAIKDIKLAQYEIYLPYTLREDLNQEAVQNTLEYIKNRIGREYRIAILGVTEKSMGEAIKMLEQNPDVEYATPEFTVYHAGGMQTAAPTASPGGGSFTTSIDVTLSTATLGANIYYTIDGETPTKSSTLYTNGVITITSTTTLKAIAIREGLADSDILTQTYIIESDTVGSTILLGDVDGDGVVTMADAMIIFDYISGKRTLTPEQILAADVDGDGIVTMADFTLVFDYISGKRPEL